MSSRGQRRTKKISEVIARDIVHDIVSRDLSPGEKLPPEAVMLETYDVGRASLREALRILEVNGLIQIRSGPGGGPVVAGVDAAEFAHMATLYLHVSKATFRDVLEARIVLEPVMAREAAHRHDVDGIRRLRDSLALAQGTAELRKNTYLEASRYFHVTVSGMSGNRVLDLFGQGLNAIYTARLRGITTLPDHEREYVEKSHADIGQAILDGDQEAAELLMRKHVEEQREFVSRIAPGILDEIVDWR